MNPRLYLETTIVGYLTSRPTRDLITTAHQKITREWWDNRRRDFALFTSQIVIQEASAGARDASAQRLAILKGIPILEVSKEASDFAARLIKKVPLPAKAAVDGLHIALAVVHNMEYLLTWNCAHIANAELRNRIEAVCEARGHKAPIICTPEELL
jgi:predicted nucleic acid-binding protein